MSSRPVAIFVATMTGLAEICAEEIAGALKTNGIESDIRLMDQIGVEALDEADTVIVVSSTYGHGDIPDNGQAFYDAVESGGSLAGKSFAVFALGDRTYMDTFCHAGEKWDDLFADKGATRITALERHDASAGTLAEDEAGEWAAQWAPALKLAA